MLTIVEFITMDRKGCGSCNQSLLALLVFAGVLILFGVNWLIEGSLALGSISTIVGVVIVVGWYRLRDASRA